MIYGEICSELRRQGLRWEATAPRKRKEEGEEKVNGTRLGLVTGRPDRRDTPGVKRPAIFADCAIMRTCRQVHSEFAAMLYAQPLQFHELDLRVGVSRIPLSPLYADLVRAVFAARTYVFQSNWDGAWLEQLQIACGLSKLFPKARVIRLGWWAATYNVYLTQIDTMRWDSAAQAAEKSIKRLKRKAGTRLSIPHNLEVVMLAGTRRNNEGSSILTPITKVVEKLRSKQPLGRTKRTRKM